MNGPALAHATQVPSSVRAVGRADASAERQAHRFAESARDGGLFADWSFAAVPLHGESGGDGPPVDATLPGSGQRLDPVLAGRFAQRLGTDLSDVRVHTDAADLTARAGADAVTVDSDIAFAPGRYDPRSAAGQLRVAHEVAHVAQQRRSPAQVLRRDGAGAVAAATTLGGLPEADRKKIQSVTTTPITVTGLDAKFSTTGGKMTLGLPAGTTVALDASVDAKLLHGLSNVVAALTTTADVSPAPMADNSTVTLALDLKKFGGINGLYRFTYHSPAATGKAAAAKRVLVEQLGAPAASTTGAPAAPAAGAAPAPDPIAAKLTKFKIKQSYSGNELDALRDAVAQVPDSHLSLVSGLNFARGAVHPKKPEVAGNYDPKTHTITMFDRAFAANQVRTAQGTRATSPATRAIVHEIGHAVDLQPIREADLARAKPNKDVADLPKSFPDPDDAKGYRWTNPAEKKQIEAILKAQKDADAKLLKSTSRSGTTEKKDAAGGFTDVIGTSAKGVKYREAAAKDGVAVSKYGEEDWQENYAEAYSLYLTAPDTLKQLRPNTFAYLDTNLPK